MTDITARLTTALADRYRIERELGAGGMATVYLAEDLKHNRMVAVKVLKPELAVAIGAERFLAEIKTTANLQHPHILALHDSGEINGTVFYVMPFVEGESLRDRLDREKQLPIADALRIAGEVADALQYAHERGVIHRDIKPENILLQRGHAVVADFGIALAASKTGGTRMTETGMSLGTPTYMSPEQAMGAREIDARTDVYSLGCVLYEMLAGEPPFVGPTAQSIVAKVMTEAPKGLTAQRHTVPAHIDATVRTSLEKLAADRFATAGAFADALRDTSIASRYAETHSPRATPTSRTRASRFARWGAAALVSATVLAAVYVLGRRSNNGGALDDVVIRLRTYHTQSIFNARYTPNGESFVYSASDGGTTPRIFMVGSTYPEPRAVSDSATHLLSVSSKDEMAILVHAQFKFQRVFSGTLARVPVGGGAPRELLANVHDADWSPDGSQLAVIYERGGRERLEFPIGTVLYEATGYLSDIRVAPDGQHVAFTEHAERGDNRGVVAIVDLKRSHRRLTPQFSAVEGLAWTPDGLRIVFAASSGGEFLQMREVTLDGVAHVSLPSQGHVTVLDIAHDGRRLVTRHDAYRRMMVRAPNNAVEKDLSWLDGSVMSAMMSSDGTLLPFTDVSNLAGANYSAMMRRTDGSPAVRLGDGLAQSISRDKQWILSTVPSVPVQLMLYPTGVGTSRRVDHGEFEAITQATFFADGTRILVCGNEPKLATRCYVRPLNDGPLRSVTPTGVTKAALSPDGKFVVAATADSGYRRFAVRDGSSQVVKGLTSDDDVLRYSPDGMAVWTRRLNALPVQIERVDLATGARSALLPSFAARRPGLLLVQEVTIADDAKSYAYREQEYVSYVFEMRGMR